MLNGAATRLTDHGSFETRTTPHQYIFNTEIHCAAQRTQHCSDKYPVTAKQTCTTSQVEDILTPTATSTVANTDVFSCATVFSFNIAVDMCL